MFLYFVGESVGAERNAGGDERERRVLGLECGAIRRRRQLEPVGRRRLGLQHDGGAAAAAAPQLDAVLLGVVAAARLEHRLRRHGHRRRRRQLHRHVDCPRSVTNQIAHLHKFSNF